jgi:hypothetical protein
MRIPVTESESMLAAAVQWDVRIMKRTCPDRSGTGSTGSREYEPASVLLERIKKERTGEPKSAKRGRKSVLTAASE